MSAADWIAADLRAEGLRLWPMGADGPLAAPLSDDAQIDTGRGGFEARLVALAAPWLSPDRPTLVVVSGEFGRISDTCRPVPCTPLAAGTAVPLPTSDPRLSVQRVPGLSQASPAGLLQGEETRLAGFLAGAPEFDGVVCLVGAQSAWVHVSAGEAVSFVAFMTGALFELISSRSALRATLAATGFDEPAFLVAVAEALSRPERLVSALLPLQAEANLAGLEPVLARSRLLGLLLGTELAAARPYWLGREVAVIGTAEASQPYLAALADQGVATRRVDETQATLAGLTAASALFGKTGQE